MKTQWNLNFFAFLCLLSISIVMATDWHVDPAGSADPNGSTENPFSTLQEALNQAQSGDKIILNPGLYTGPGNYNLDPNGRILTIQGTNPQNPEVAAQTIIDPNYAGRGFILQNNEDPNFLFAGFTIRNTWCDQEDNPPHGSAISCSEASPTIQYCIFQDCDADGGWGGAIYGKTCNSSIEHCLFIGNKARYGGALAMIIDSQITLAHCTIAGNQALFNGGGFVCDFDTSITMINSILTLNRLFVTQNEGWQASIRDSAFKVFYSMISNEPNDLEIVGSSLLTLGEGVIHTDPEFAFYDSSVPSTVQDFHLQSEAGRWNSNTASWITDSVTSPCIDSGDPNAVWSAEPWPNGKRINMGFYGGTQQASMNGNPADFDVSGQVNLADFSELAELWFSNVFSDFHDLSGDDRIDISDLEEFSGEWLWE